MMINPDKKTFTITSEDGQTQEFDILFAFSNQENGREYVVFTDYSPSEQGGTSLSAASYDPKDPENTLAPIEEDEWEAVYHILYEMKKELESR